MLVSELTREKFWRLKKDQLITLSEEEVVELEKGMTKPALTACFSRVLGLEKTWSEQDREREKELKRQEMEKERAHLEKMVRIELGKVALMGCKAEQSFDINRAHSFM